MRKRRRPNIKCGIDSGIRSTVKKLNKQGIKTKYSCAGHRATSKYKQEQGYIAFNKKLSEENIRQAKDILHNKGVKRIGSKTKTMRHGKATVFSFSPRE